MLLLLLLWVAVTLHAKQCFQRSVQTCGCLVVMRRGPVTLQVFIYELLVVITVLASALLGSNTLRYFLE